jgi:hypothetical protein
VIDLDASVVQVASDQKENARPTYKGGVGYVPNLAVCDNVDDVLVIDPRPGNATSNDAADNIAALTAAIAAIPGTYRRRVLVRLDGAGFSHKLLEHIATGGGVKGRRWEFSVCWACTDREIDAIDKTPKQVWHNAIEQDGTLIDDTRVADISPTAARREVPPPVCSTCRSGPRRSPAFGSSSETSRCTRSTPSGPATGRRPAAAATS